MRVARARYTGRKGTHTRRRSDGTRVRFRPRNRSDPWTDIEDVEFARELEETMNYEVDWTVRGVLAAKGKDVLDWGYQQKRSLASDLGLSFDGQPDSDELDGELERYIETMEEQGGL